LISQPELLSLAGEKRQLSFVFTDIAGFTTLSEQIPPEQLTTILNDYLDGMCKVVHRHEGIVDKFIGDAVMAVFNAPISQKDHADRAVRCALEMDSFCQGFRQKIESEMGLGLGVTRIGVHSGEAIIGNFGAENRMDFTALGDTVNAASRVEGVNKYFGTRVCVTQGIVDSVTLPGLHFRPIGDVMLKGKDKALSLYEPLDATSWQTPRVQTYMRAFSALQAKESQAVTIFAELLASYPDDPLVLFHNERIARGELSSVIRMDEK
jgi:class 3 adenylate cyclase